MKSIMIWYFRNSYDHHHCTRCLQHVRDVDAWDDDEERRCSLLAIVTANGQRLAWGINIYTFCLIQDRIISPNAGTEECNSTGCGRRKTSLKNCGSDSVLSVSWCIMLSYLFFRMLDSRKISEELSFNVWTDLLLHKIKNDSLPVVLKSEYKSLILQRCSRSRCFLGASLRISHPSLY